MPICPFATWFPISGPSGSHIAGPFKIVHHSTEGANAEGAFSAFRANRSDPHFTVDATRIYQHIDTSAGARALRNEPGGVQTNRDSAVQIELVGFAHRAKDPDALRHLARLCRWIEETHGVPRTWPSGPPKPAKNGKDPGGHNRNTDTWDNQGGHYGHCHVPENTHWDPGYTSDEIDFLMTATFTASGDLVGGARPRSAAASRRAGKAAKRRATPAAKAEKSTMPDHATVPTGMTAYIRDLTLLSNVGAPALRARRAGPRQAASASDAATTPSALVNTGSVLSFLAGVSTAEAQDVLDSIQLAQRGASGLYDRFTQTESWYAQYLEILENIGWAADQFAFSSFQQEEGEFRMDKAALGVIAAIATQNQLAILQKSLEALEQLAESDGAIALFDMQSTQEGSGNFQLGAASKTENGLISLALGAYHFKGTDRRRRFLFFKWGARALHFWTAAQRMTLNGALYAAHRDDIAARLQSDSGDYIHKLKLGK